MKTIKELFNNELRIMSSMRLTIWRTYVDCNYTFSSRDHVILYESHLELAEGVKQDIINYMHEKV